MFPLPFLNSQMSFPLTPVQDIQVIQVKPQNVRVGFDFLSMNSIDALNTKLLSYNIKLQPPLPIPGLNEITDFETAIGRQNVFLNDVIQDYLEKIQNFSNRLKVNMASQIKTYETKMEALEQNLYILNPKTVLARGYSIVTNIDKKILNDSKNINVDDNIHITFHNGHARAKITDKNSKS